MRPLFVFLVTASFLLGFTTETTQLNKPIKILHDMFDSIRSIHTLRTKISALERLEEGYVSADSEIKLQVHPRKLYFINPGKKLEILYNAEVSKKATVKPHIFPYLTIHLEPGGNLMRKNQHYTIHELGFDFISKSIALTINNDKDAMNHFVYHGKVNKNGYSCHLVTYENKNYSFKTYTVGAKETASSIAYRLCVNDYLLRYKNNLLNDFGYLKKGSILIVPTVFCKNAVIYADAKTMLPISISLSDDIGLFESYSFSSTIINQPFDKDEFSVHNKAYGF